MVGTYGEAAKAIGIGYDQLRKIMDEGAVPSFASIAALSGKTGVALAWLAFGRLPQLDEGAFSTGKYRSGPEGSRASGSKNPDVVLVRRYDLQFAVGAGAEAGEESVEAALPFSRRYLEAALRCKVEDVAIGEARGDSMEPTIGDGDLVMVNLRRRSISSGVVFVMRLGNELVVKRVQRDTDGTVLLISDNKLYPDRRLTAAEADQVEVIGQMIWKGSAA